MGSVMGPSLWWDLCGTSVLDAEFFVQQGALLKQPVVLCCESHAGVDAVGGPGTRVYDGVVC